MGNKIYLMRHAEVAKPEEKIFAGSIDLMLSRNGILQAEELGRTFSKLNLKKVYSSNLSRSMNTARIISEICSCSFEVLDGIQEIHLGQWEGRTFSEIMEKHPVEFERRGKEMYTYKTPGGESFKEVRERSCKALFKVVEEVFSSKASGNVLIVSHGGVNKALVAELTGKSFEQCFSIKQPYGCVNIVTMEENGLRVLVNVPLEEL